MRRFMLSLAILILVAVALGGAIGGPYVYRHYFAHQAEVDRILSALPPGEANPPETLCRVILKLNPSGVDYFVTRSLIAELYPQPMRQIERHLRNLIWWQFLPRRLTQAQMLALYAHFMQFEGGRGLAYGAEHYYRSSPTDLSDEEALQLYVISKSPERYSPGNNPERFHREVERLSDLLREPAA